MVFEENFLRLTDTVHFQKKKKKKEKNFKDVNFLILFFFKSIGRNNVAVTKQIYFSPTF